MSWGVNEVMTGSDGPENLKILKKCLSGVDCGLGRQTTESFPLGHRELSSLPRSRVVGGFDR